VASRNLWDLSFDEAVALCEAELAADPEYHRWLDAVAAQDRCVHCGADLWGFGVVCGRCGKAVLVA
jgi:hypothetical protein